jgi:hypothetical protein
MRSRMICRLLAGFFCILAFGSVGGNLHAQSSEVGATTGKATRAEVAVSYAPTLNNFHSSVAITRHGQGVADYQSTGQNPTGQNPTGQNPTGQNPTGQNPTGQNLSGNQAGNATGGDTLAPLQSRQLTLGVQAVSISSAEIGTGLVPTATRPKWSDQDLIQEGQSRDSYFTQVYWQASLIQHFPLYFEDAMLERHGHTRCCRGWELTQSAVSGLKFFGTIPMLPYLATLQPKHQCVYALGHYRAGSAAPCLRSNLPYDKRAAIVESASVAGFFWAAPL